MAMTSYAWEQRVRSGTATVAIAGYIGLALLIGGFGYWAATAPLAGAAVAQGTVAATGRNVFVQHFEGGVIHSLLVREGDRVRTGQTLIVLDDTAARSQVNRLDKQYATLAATVERLVAERDGTAELIFSEDVRQRIATSKLKNLAAEQDKEFKAKLARYQSELDILRQRVTTLGENLVGLDAQKAAINNQLDIVSDDLIRKKKLVDQGLTNHFEYTQIQRNQANLIGQSGAVEAELAATRSQVIEAKEQIERLKTQRVEQAVSQLAEIRTNLTDTEEQLSAAQAVLRRTTISSPTEGVIVSAIYNSPGSVAAPGEKLIEILPTGSRMIVDARISPNDVDAVHAGQTARLKLTALNARTTPEVSGTVLDVSADRLVDNATHEAFYRTRIQISEVLPESVTLDQLYPGMPVEAFIGTGDRTFLEYLMKPIRDSFQRAFVED
ncbi:HlyD family type I secretion periplasmic adaptor subunit [Mesorhizobium loti]|nr:HlyD family type I secretion periplasmic adaptor subunit [Mesorhizobium loti]